MVHSDDPKGRIHADNYRRHVYATREKVTQLQPTSASPWLDKGQVLVRLGRYEEALQAFSQAVNFSQGWPIPGVHKGSLLLRLDRYAEAERLLKPLLKHGQRIRGIYSGYGLALANAGKFAEALPWFKRATRASPHLVDGWLFRGWALQELRRPQEALAALERAMKLDPRDVRLTYAYCRVLFALGKHSRALQELPVSVVAHQTFHELIKLANKGLTSRQLAAELTKWQSLLVEGPGPEALAGALIEFASQVSQQTGPSDLPDLQKWSGVITDLFKDQSRFEMIRKVFGVMVRYKESGDEKVLLELPLEQRQLLESKDTEASHPLRPKPQTSGQ